MGSDNNNRSCDSNFLFLSLEKVKLGINFVRHRTGELKLFAPLCIAAFSFSSLRSAFNNFIRSLTVAILAAVVMAGCSSGGDEDSGSSTFGGSSLSGTAATGAPVAFGTVTIKDSTGATATTTTDVNGNYSFDVSAKRFPVMLQAQPSIPGAAPLFSAALTSGTANTTPLTNLQVFEALGRTDPSDVFNSGDFSKIGDSTLDYGKTTVNLNLVSQLTSNGLDPANLDPITTPMIANGVGMDAVLDNVNIAIAGSNPIITDAKGACVPYGLNFSGVTFAIDGMSSDNFDAFFSDIPTIANFLALLSKDSLSSKGYVEASLRSVCIAGDIEQIDWSTYPSLPVTSAAIETLKGSIRLAVQNGKQPINVVAHSWGTVIAYIALDELANEPSVKVASLITMGSPLWILALDPKSTDGLLYGARIQSSVPNDYRGKPIHALSNVGKWINYYNEADIISGALPSSAANNENVHCPSGFVETNSITSWAVVGKCSPHTAYFDPYFLSPTSGIAETTQPTLQSISQTAKTLLAIRNIIDNTQMSSVSTVTATPPTPFSLTVDVPHCDRSNPPGPAVNLAWSASDGAAYYRVFRNDSAIGVNLNASQLSFLNNLGLVAGQAYSYKVQAINANGTTWSDTVQITIPTAVCDSATDPKITVGPATLNFGNVAVGSCGTATVAVQHVMGTNPASGTVSVGPNPPFSITSGGSFSVSNGSAANVTVQFCPSSPLTYTGTATATSSATFTGTNTVALSGTGVTQIMLPLAPSNLTANALSQNYIALTWQDNSDNETGFKIERKTGTNGTFAQIATTGPISGVGSGGYYENAGLTAGTTYCYRTRAYNTAGDSSYTSENCATTQQAPVITPPTATTIPATNVTSNSATLNGTVNPNGTASGAFFQWGTTTSYGNLTPNDTTPGSGTTAQPVFANLTGLSPNTTYHFRIVASSGPNTTVFGADQSFTTASALKEVIVANLSGGLLMLRSGPSVSNSIVTTLAEGTRMSVIGGPVQADGFTWWNISGVNGTGWSVVGEWLVPTPQIGQTVTVSYTGGVGLRLRETASLSGAVITTLPEGTQMTVFGGPVQANGYTWWAIQGVVNGTLYTGWSAVGDWLTPNPRY